MHPGARTAWLRRRQAQTGTRAGGHGGADGHWLAIAVAPASVQERDTLPALDKGKVAWPNLRVAILDGAFTAERCREWPNLHGMRHEVVVRLPGQRGFAVLLRRWVVDRSFGWLTH